MRKALKLHTFHQICAVLELKKPCLEHNFLLRLTHFLLRLIRRIAKGNEYDRLHIVGKLKHLTTLGCIEIAHPASAQSLFYRGKADMLHSNGDVNVGMVFVVRPTMP